MACPLAPQGVTPDTVESGVQTVSRNFPDAVCPGTEDGGEVRNDALAARAVALLQRPRER